MMHTQKNITDKGTEPVYSKELQCYLKSWINHQMLPGGLVMSLK